MGQSVELLTGFGREAFQRLTDAPNSRHGVGGDVGRLDAVTVQVVHAHRAEHLTSVHFEDGVDGFRWQHLGRQTRADVGQRHHDADSHGNSVEGHEAAVAHAGATALPTPTKAANTHVVALMAPSTAGSRAARCGSSCGWLKRGKTQRCRAMPLIGSRPAMESFASSVGLPHSRARSSLVSSRITAKPVIHRAISAKVTPFAALVSSSMFTRRR